MKKIIFIFLILILSMSLFSIALKKNTSSANAKTIDQIKPDLIVAQDGSGNYKNVTEAINAVPEKGTKWFVIYIKNGTYKEIVTVPENKTFIHLIGEDAVKTILTYDNYNLKMGSTLASSSTFIKGNDFIAENITFENGYDYYNNKDYGEQAVALTSMADRIVFLNCRFIGYQDTLFVKEGRNYFKKCYIQGTIDFIFGEGTAVFDECEIRLLRNASYISAPSTLESTKYGMIFMNCNMTADPKLIKGVVYLGRPWHPSFVKEPVKSNAVFLFCNLGLQMKDSGWSSMGKTNPNTERFFEYKNKGAGAKINPDRPQLTDEQAAQYTISNILKGQDNWDPESLIK